MPYANEVECQQFIEALRPECCLRCRFFRKDDEATTTRYDVGRSPVFLTDLRGECKRRAPVAMLIDGEDETVFPQVSGKNWCGEFEASTEDRGISYVCAPFIRLSEQSR